MHFYNSPWRAYNGIDKEIMLEKQEAAIQTHVSVFVQILVLWHKGLYVVSYLYTYKCVKGISVK